MINLLTKKDAPLLARKHFENGMPGPITRSLAHVPEMLNVTLPFIGTVLGTSGIDIRVKEIVILRTSYLFRCNYCVNTHTFVASRAGLSNEEIFALRGQIPVPEAFTEKHDVLLIQWTDAMADSSKALSTKLKNDIKQYFSEGDIVELTLLASTTIMLNRYATIMELPVSEKHLSYLQEKGLTF